jgi:hypothetical protein
MVTHPDSKVNIFHINIKKKKKKKNNSKNSTTGFAPNELLIRWEPPLATEQRSESKNQTTEEYLANIR